jgi:hypothetical protein
MPSVTSSKQPTVFTAYYASKKFDRAKHYLVRISIGSPRWMNTDDVCLDFAPNRAWLTLDVKSYFDKYDARLEGVGIRRVKSMLDALTVRAKGNAVVLYCFESLSPENVAKSQWCHRQVFSEWVKFRGRLVVPQL